MSLSTLQKNWKVFEKHLVSIVQTNEFCEFRQSYKGLQRNDHTSFAKDDFVSAITHLFDSEFFETLSSTKVPGSNSRDGRRAFDSNSAWDLMEAEKWINLLLFLWKGSDNCQDEWRTLVHFTKTSQFQFLIKNLITVKIHERGLLLFQVNVTQTDRFFPNIHSLGKALGPHPEKTSPHLINHLLFLLLDEWEYAFSCMSHTHLAVIKQKSRTALESELQQVKLKNLMDSRDKIALYTLKGLNDFQDAVFSLQELGQKTSTNGSKGNVRHNLTANDLNLEVLATERLLLAAIQKTFLPASVSRHTYSGEVLESFYLFFGNRAAKHPNDCASLLVAQLLGRGFFTNEPRNKSQNFFEQIVTLLEKPAYHWSLSFDPAPAIKAFSWTIPHEDYVDTVALYIVLLEKKSEPEALSTQKIEEFLEFIDFPQTFGVKVSPKDTKSRIHPGIRKQALTALTITKSQTSQKRSDISEQLETLSHFFEQNHGT